MRTKKSDALNGLSANTPTPLEGCGKSFDVKICDLPLPFTFYTRDEIMKKLDDYQSIISYDLIEGSRSEIRKKCKSKAGEKKYFAYIKFFNYEKKQYGIVGGKTNSFYCDVSFDYDYKKDRVSLISRNFLSTNNLSWYEGILRIRKNGKETSEQEALFLETFVQRLFNLLDS